MPRLTLLLLAGLAWCSAAWLSASAQTTAEKGPPAMTAPTLAKATFGGGCFWCTEAVFERVKGVGAVVSGYAGGTIPNPSYRQVCSGTTGHAEVIQVDYDPAQVSFDTLLDLFFASHDPTTLNRQRADTGTQYRPGIFCHSSEQRQAAEAKIQALTAAKAFTKPIVTELAEAATFYPAEAYHQDYFRLNPRQSYCQAVIAPQLQKFTKQHPALLKP